jgi:hypothetical protein
MNATDRYLMPSLAEARRLARRYEVVPLYAELIGDLETPISAALRFADEENVFLLESAEAAERFGRYSFLGFDPKRTLSYRDGIYTIVDADGVREVAAKDPFSGLAELVGKKSVAPLLLVPAIGRVITRRRSTRTRGSGEAPTSDRSPSLRYVIYGEGLTVRKPR